MQPQLQCLIDSVGTRSACVLPGIIEGEDTLKVQLIKEIKIGKCEDPYAETRLFEDTIKSSAQEYSMNSHIFIFMCTHLCDHRTIDQS